MKIRNNKIKIILKPKIKFYKLKKKINYNNSRMSNNKIKR